MKRILIDLTDLELWSGNHGGTQRVVYGIAKNFYLQQETLDYEVVFIAFSPHHKRFRVTSFDSIYQRAESFKIASSPIGTTKVVPLTARFKQQLRPYVPEAVRKNKMARRAATRTLQVAHSAVSRAKASPMRQIKKSSPGLDQPIYFQKDDTVLILGKPWDNLDIQRTLTAEKNKTGFKFVQVVYDLIICLYPHLHHPSLFTSYTQHMFEAVSASDLMLPISESSANDLREFCKRLNLAIPSIKVIRLGDEVVNEITAEEKPDEHIADNFIACIGTIEIRKNHTLLYYTYKLALERGIKLPQLVIVGNQGWLTGDFQYLVQNDPSVKEKIIILNNVNDAGLNWIYKNCMFTVYPSFYEGWGLPVAESLAYGKLCVATNTSSVPEIGGDLVSYFSPHNSQECLETLVRYLNPAELRKKEVEIKDKYKPVNWDHTFHQVLKII